MANDTHLTALALIRATLNEDPEAVRVLAAGADLLLVTALAGITAGFLQEACGGSEKRANAVLDGWTRQVLGGVAP